MIWKSEPEVNYGQSSLIRGPLAIMPRRCHDGYTIWWRRPWVVKVWNYPILRPEPASYGWHVDYIAAKRTNAEARALMRHKEQDAELQRHRRIVGGRRE